MSIPIRSSAAEPDAPAVKNRAATISEIAAICAVSGLISLATVVGWVAPGFFVGFAVLSSIVAIVAGHVGRARGRRLGGAGRGIALAGIIVGWVCLVGALLGTLALVGILAGIGALTD